jgi:hypothetical protein
VSVTPIRPRLKPVVPKTHALCHVPVVDAGSGAHVEGIHSHAEVLRLTAPKAIVPALVLDDGARIALVHSSRCVQVTQAPP